MTALEYWWLPQQRPVDCITFCHRENTQKDLHQKLRQKTFPIPVIILIHYPVRQTETKENNL